MLIDDNDNILSIVNTLKKMGVALSIDDFGKGYSNLSYIKKFRVDKIKIDQSFISELCDDSNMLAIVRAVVQMAEGLDLRTIAEGVENAESLAVLQRLGCHEIQGYYIAKPMSGDKLADFILDWPSKKSAVARRR
jgi:EAL domain-containing protein (putative c-di-GMP-specific phosphodiesterase class I)